MYVRNCRPVTKQLSIQPLDDFYASSTKTFDLTEFVESEKHEVAEALPFTDIELLFSEPKSILAQTFNDQNNHFMRHCFIQQPQQRPKYSIKLPFEKNAFERLSDTSITTIHQRIILSDDLNPSIGKPLIFYAINQDCTNDPINYVDTFRLPEGEPVTAGNRYKVSQYMMPLNTNEIGGTITPPQFTLTFGSRLTHIH